MYQLYTMRRRSPLLNKHKHRNPTLKMHHIFKRFRNPCGFGHDFVLFALFFSLFAFFFSKYFAGIMGTHHYIWSSIFCRVFFYFSRRSHGRKYWNAKEGRLFPPLSFGYSQDLDNCCFFVSRHSIYNNIGKKNLAPNHSAIPPNVIQMK